MFKDFRKTVTMNHAVKVHSISNAPVVPFRFECLTITTAQDIYAAKQTTTRKMAIMGSSSSPRSNNNNNAATASSSSSSAAGPQFRIGTATTSPEFVAVILAATHGANLFPFTAAPCNSTSSSNNKNDNDATTLPLLQPPKHLLPLVGVSLLHRLIKCLQQCGRFSNIVICIAHDDDVTIPSLLLLEQDGTTANQQGCWKVDDVATKAANTTTATTTTDPKMTTTTSAAAADASFRNSPVVILQQQQQAIIDHAQPQPLQQQRLIIVRLPFGGEGGEGGSIDALRQVEATRIISKHSHIVVFPSDLVILNGTVAIQQFVHAHRLRQQQQQQQQHEEESSSTSSIYSSSPVAAAACTVLLADVGEEDENGIPLKESAKQKKGGLAREDEAIEYTALAYDDNDDDYNHNHNSITTPRLIWKQSKFDVEADEHFTGNTPKLVLPKPRLRLACGGGTMTTTTTTVKVQTNWNDLHVYIFSPWVRRLITTRTSLLSIQNDLIPLLIARQTKGICATFGSKMDKIKVHDILRNDNNNNNGVIMTDDDSVAHSSSPIPTPHHHPPSSSVQGLSKVARTTSSSSEKQGVNVGVMIPYWLTCEYAVLGHVIPGAAAVRANSIPAFLHASKELVTQFIVASSSSSSSRTTSTRTNPCLFLPPNSTVRAKSFSVILPETTNDMLGEKITFKSSIIGRHCKLGAKCRLNNVIVFDNVTLGDNCIIQNTIIGPGAVLGDNCSLNDCQVAPSKVVVSGTKQKGEALLLDDDHDHHDHNTY